MIRDWEVYLHEGSVNLNVQTAAGWESLRLDRANVPIALDQLRALLAEAADEISVPFPAGTHLVPRQAARQWIVALESAVRQWAGEQLTDEDLIARMGETVEPPKAAQ